MVRAWLQARRTAGDSAAAGARPRLCVRVASAESKEFLRQIYYDSFMFDV